MIKVIARIISLDHFADFPGALPANAPIARKTRRVREEAPHACSPSRSEITCLSNSKWLVRKGLCLRQRQRYWSGGFSEQGRQASITVDIGRFSASATFRQLIPCPRSLRASSRRKTRCGRPSRVPLAFAARTPA